MPSHHSSRRAFLKTLGLTAAALALPKAAFAGNDGRRCPNIVLILADDLGYGDLGCYGSKTIRTPHLDELAENGMRLTDFYVNAPVCSPTRAGLLTGRSHLRCGAEKVFLEGDENRGLPLNETLISEVLRNAGYATGVFGKWHLGYEEVHNPINRGFDEFVGHLSGYQDYRTRARAKGAYDWYHGTELTPEEGYSTHLIADYSVRFIENHKEKPFFLYMSHQAPHSPYQGPEDGPIRKVGEAFNRRQEEEERHAKYIEMVEAMDAAIGRVVGKVRELGLEEETFIFFLSDNGPSWLAGTTGGLRGGKHSTYEGGIRVPAIASMPGKVPAGTVSSQPATCLDLFPTILRLADVPIPKDLDLDGINLAPMLFEREPLPERVLCWRYLNHSSVRDDNWKLYIQDHPKSENTVELFNLDSDIFEKENLAEKHPEIVDRLSAELEKWLEGIKNDRKRLARE